MGMLLTMLKADLGILTTTLYDERLSQYIESARAAILQEGATTLDPDANMLDAQLVVMYAAWLFRRRDAMDGMPRMLRWALNNRIMSEKAGAAHD